MNIDPNKDGIDHINVYSKGATKLGRILSNFAYTPFVCEDGYFSSIEGYWYWLLVDEESEDRDKLRELYGFKAKELGRSLGAVDWGDSPEFKSKICKALWAKANRNNDDILYLAEMSMDLPLRHYYVYGGKVVEPKEGKWIIEELEKIRKVLVY